jgi:hypothetical protein
MKWIKSSFSFANGNCVEIAAWRKSSRSIANGDCVEVGQNDAVVGVRDTMDRGGPVMIFSGAEWNDFLYGIRQDTYLVPDPATV